MLNLVGHVTNPAAQLRTPASIAGEKTDAASEVYDRGWQPKAPFPNEESLSEFISGGNRFERLQGFKYNKDNF